MARFNDPGVNRTHSHLVDFFSGNAVVIGAAGDIFGVVVSEYVRQAPVIGMVPDHFQPGVAFRADAILFGDFPFKQVKRLAVGAQGGIGRWRIRFGHQQAVGAQHRQQLEDPSIRIGKKLDHLASGADDMQRLPAKRFKGQVRDGVPGNGRAIEYFDKTSLH